MKFKLTSVFFFLRKKLIMNIMRTFIFLFCTTIFGFSPGNLFSQNTKIVIAADKTVTVDEVFDIIKDQTEYTFIYQEDLFKKLPKVHLKKGVIKVNDLLKMSLSSDDFEVLITKGNAILVTKTVEPTRSNVIQNPVVKGVVTDDTGKPLASVNIKLKDSKITAKTDENGAYAIEASSNSVLLFSFVGYKSQVVRVNGRIIINVTLQLDSIELSATVVNTGVTVRKKELITGAVTVFSGADLRKVSTQNAIQALKTLDPAFVVVDNALAGSNPNALPVIEVRGQTSLTQNQVQTEFGQDPNQPLFILDGFPTTLQQIVDLDINRIASITLLKDAASTALYGSRSANGVVVIETIKPVAGKLQVGYTHNSSFEVADLSVYNLMNAEQKLEFERLSGAYSNGNSPTNQYEIDQVYNNRLADVRRGVNTYWLNEPVQVGITSGHTLSLGGGSEEFRFSMIGNYKTVEGTMKGSERNTWGYNTTLLYRKNKLNISNNIFINGGNKEESRYGSFRTYVEQNPYYRKYNENGIATPYLDGTSIAPTRVIVNNPTNPLYNASLPSFNRGNDFNFTNNFSLNYDVTAHFRATGALSITRNNSHRSIFVSPLNTIFINDIPTTKGSYNLTESVQNNWNANFGGTYSNVFKRVHSFNYTLRATVLENRSNSFGSTLRGFPAGVPADPKFAFGFEETSKPITSNLLVRNIDLTNQVNYAYDRRFLFDFTSTIAGATNFGTNKKYSPYWGIGIGWNLHNEFKMNGEIVNLLKIRGNYGITGNQNLAGFASQDVYGFTANTNAFGAGLSLLQVANPDLEPQRTKDLSVGIDFSMFENRLTGTINGYNRETSPQIVAVNLASSTGLQAYPFNIGYIKTTGIEFRVNYNIINNIHDNIVWGLGFTLGSNDNKLGGFGNSLQSLNDLNANKTGNSANLLRYYDGASSSDLWAVPSLGIDPGTGREVFLKKDGQTTFDFDRNDEVVMGNSRETAQGIITTNLNYKNFSFGLNIRYSFGAERFNNALFTKVENIGSDQVFNNQDVRAFTDRWTTPGQIAQFKAIGNTSSTPISSRFIQKEDYLSGESVRFGYRVTNKQWLNSAGLGSLSVNVLGNEFFRKSTLKAERGIDYPFSRVYSLNLNITL